ncbi:MAG: addiction module component CHP02574 family protein [Planctomycetota bacterium]|nr:MAG: addiction module component CHP02574 family protein [Planctomycetota bacterium]
MSTVSEILSAALTLTTSERAEVAHELLLSLEPEDSDALQQAWAEEIQERLQAIREGRATLRDGDEVLADISKSLESQRVE